MEVYARPEVV